MYLLYGYHQYLQYITISKATMESPTHLKMSNYQNTDDFKIQNVNEVPNRFICFIKVKIQAKEKGIIVGQKTQGSGVMIDENYLLTAAHNVLAHGESIQKVINRNWIPQDNSYVKMALHNGENKGQFKIASIRISSKYKKNQKEASIYDYALLEITPFKPQEFSPQPFYPPVLALSVETLSNLKKISVYGYPIQTNKNNAPNDQKDNSSIYIKDMYRSTGNIKRCDELKLSYTLPTQCGFSGGPVFTQYQGLYAVIAIHKAFYEKEEENVAVNTHQMIQDVNDWGYEIRKRPFVFTEKTLALRKKEDKIKDMDILYLSDLNLQWPDMFVITSYDLSNVKKIILSGNSLGEEGVTLLTRRPLPALLYLSLPQNSIRSLESPGSAEFPGVQWNNIASLKTLILSIFIHYLCVNLLNSFPPELCLLEKLETLYLSYNKLPEISQNLVDYCKNVKQKIVIFLYDNKIIEQLPSNRERKALIEKTMVHVVWSREQKANEFP